MRLLAVPVALILLVTLVPAGGASSEPVARVCVFCGERAVADVLLNVLLFAPLGAALAAAGAAGWATLAAATALSAAIEVAQLWIPGRYTSAFDVAANAGGALAGWLVIARGVLPRLLHRRRAVSLAAAALPVLVVAATTLLLAPALPRDAAYVGRWTSALPDADVYDGQLATVRIGGTPLPDSVPVDGSLVRAALLAGEPLVVTGHAGSRVARYAQIFGVVADGSDLFWIGAAGDDAVFGFRTRAGALRLDQPEHRLAGAFAPPLAGEPLRIEVRRAGRGWCLRVGDTASCDLVFSIADGWMLLLYPRGLPPRTRRGLGWIWLAALAVPAGATTRPTAARATTRAIAIATGIAAAALLATSAVLRAEHALALALGYAAGVLLRRALTRSRTRRPLLVRPRGSAHLS